MEVLNTESGEKGKHKTKATDHEEKSVLKWMSLLKSLCKEARQNQDIITNGVLSYTSFQHL